jgi:hypothetical protein
MLFDDISGLETFVQVNTCIGFGILLLHAPHNTLDRRVIDGSADFVGSVGFLGSCVFVWPAFIHETVEL